MKKVKTVDDYLAEQPEEARRILQEIRKAITGAAPEAEETISYDIPLYKLGGKHLVGFGGWKSHLSLFVTNSAVFEKYESELADFDHAGTKSTIRFTLEKPIPVGLVKKIVRTRVEEIGAG
ncbi:MAG: iron chaperone [Solirubrobacterales bacterium]